ncbi:F-box/FBD/LRR-repeat protein At2g04230-like isoform X2 [Arabidopsis lyrata subsp. lyrata]|uniref:F-box/FBD/LRR-repeat protein At2g04230-like isoform X2 n=1 Tax=Arabidopsis lyrata subsp. lyrata TaxID=81972 RepID=UPI000A29B0D2|nr:F-box/FBD/LRR-repeat protein At2g04230-like isoform X2 [Arabidopsis lyrata subsp. lyrata]|eukprot:XP_020879881.1 F-box/FBD/LRR-repeat protein At2g04230-like isoform X2 [Arabidopsis lyrata subsp. lyrata]
MEQKLKTDGLGLSNRNAMNKDRISDLPEALLLHILSSLPTEKAIATSVLSKRWRSLWKMVPKLKFDYKFHPLADMDAHVFSENVYRSLSLHKAPVLESLHLTFEGRTDCMDVGIWIATAFARRVRKLVLVSVYHEEQIVILPSVLFSCNDTLEILKLKYAIDLEFPPRVCLKSLRKLYLYEVQFKDEESVSNFLCGCPSLEDLVVHRYSNADVENFTIVVPSLQRLTIKDLNQEGGNGDGGYVINAPALKYLDIDGFKELEYFFIEEAPELVEAKISDVSDIANENILVSLTSAKRLSLHLSPLEIDGLNGEIFDQLVYLELRTHETEWWNLLSIMLDSSPKLQILKLTDVLIINFRTKRNGIHQIMYRNVCCSILKHSSG